MSLQKAREMFSFATGRCFRKWFVLSSSFLGIAFHPLLPEFDKAGTSVTATVNAIP
jgi:hypothetical protein